MKDLTGAVIAALAELGVAPEKRRGQNFMIRPETLGFIAASLDLAPGEPVLEIGPGLGFLTDELLARGGRVTAIEKDFVLARRLRDAAGERPLVVVEKDILEVDPSELGLHPPLKVAGNIPYNITSPILEWLIDHRRTVRRAVITVQREVADRLRAAPGGKTWGSLSVFVQVYARVEVLRILPPRTFFPAPQVESAVVRLEFDEKSRWNISNEGAFFYLVRKAFQKRRKTLLNALADETVPGLRKPELAEALSRAGIDPMRRPETLSIPDWARLGDCVILAQ